MKTKFLVGLLILGIILVSGCVQKGSSAKLGMEFAKTQFEVGEPINVTLTLKNVGNEPFSAENYIFSFDRKEELPNRTEFYVIEQFSIQGPVKPGQVIEKTLTLPTEEVKPESYVFVLSFEEVIKKEPWESLVIETLEKEIKITE